MYFTYKIEVHVATEIMLHWSSRFLTGLSPHICLKKRRKPKKHTYVRIRV